ncbi:histidine phosphatase family protein [Pseudonocardia sp. KRD-184]|uniref:Histidine phosphatase family protein n=1 Tax=Pseudonocardia oceani TaxID=2792013 RepID=A0ABS6UJR2_9PSEU|nr:histidine phosphatase family protein [Pseudonocardia oceani]MBW0088608.1 histidine phosphatase family protein [Pseudonocardia oceani]MBW0095451.1 histidine phosphatase family protein [Pseudonocardia oceani]MBW0109048.1 histidine phosphatase family protein [Pseudonocardia oceani]MBW0120027.1 histidine phosphatase family protein [Pseudonocardia oceani]MBW0132483.1 histidine phosphatase family protein [Pseudonocardia oceani]
MQLLLVRHGQTPANVLGELGTRIPGPGLTPLGERQAAAVPDVLGRREIDAIFVSLMVRTHLTAAPLAAARRLRPVELDGIHEVEAGGLEDRSDADAVGIYQDVLACWAGGDTSVSMPGGPDGAAFLGRFDASVAAVLRSGAATAVVFSHGASIRAWTGARADNLDAAFVRTHRLGNTGLVEMRGDFATGWTCVSWRSDPVGGEDLVDRSASDPTGEAATATADGRACSP